MKEGANEFRVLSSVKVVGCLIGSCDCIVVYGVGFCGGILWWEPG